MNTLAILTYTFINLFIVGILNFPDIAPDRTLGSYFAHAALWGVLLGLLFLMLRRKWVLTLVRIQSVLVFFFLIAVMMESSGQVIVILSAFLLILLDGVWLFMSSQFLKTPEVPPLTQSSSH